MGYFLSFPLRQVAWGRRGGLTLRNRSIDQWRIDHLRSSIVLGRLRLGKDPTANQQGSSEAEETRQVFGGEEVPGEK